MGTAPSGPSELDWHSYTVTGPLESSTCVRRQNAHGVSAAGRVRAIGAVGGSGAEGRGTTGAGARAANAISIHEAAHVAGRASRLACAECHRFHPSRPSHLGRTLPGGPEPPLDGGPEPPLAKIESQTEIPSAAVELASFREQLQARYPTPHPVPLGQVVPSTGANDRGGADDEFVQKLEPQPAERTGGVASRS